jgi:hypothetical protein
MSRDADRLFNLLPEHVRRRDAETGEPLRALLAVIAEQADIVEADLEQLYDDWFIETCADWTVPYIGDLVGYQLLGGYAEALAAGGPAAALLAASLTPRRDVADTVANRRRKGTLVLLQDLAMDVAGWPARAVEFDRLLAQTQPVRLYPADQAAAARRRHVAAGRLADLRQGALLDLLWSPFDPVSRLAEAPRITSARRQGRYGPPAVGLFVWRLPPYSLTHAPAYCIDRARNQYTFSILGNDAPLVTRPVALPAGSRVATSTGHADQLAAGAENVPAFITRRILADRLAAYYGPGKSFTIWRDASRDPVALADLVVADLSDWTYRAGRNQVVIDPELGRIAFGGRHAPDRGVWVTWHYAFSRDIGGGEYPRDVSRAPEAKLYRVGPGEQFERINQAYEQWKQDNAEGGQPEAVIEIAHSDAYQEQIELAVGAGERLELRAADGARPVLRLLDWYSNRPDALQIRGLAPDAAAAGEPPKALGRVVLDGLLITGRGVSVTGPVGSVVIRDCTLVPGWSLDPRCEPTHPEEPSVVLESTDACLEISRSILGTILVIADQVTADPLPIHVADSILDATAPDREVLSAPDCELAYAVLHIYRTTVIGEVHAHAIAIAENSVFDGCVRVARRGAGCMRFCYVPPGSRTPRRYHCQPDQVWAGLRDEARRGVVDPADLPALEALAATRVRPEFTSVRYGTPAYVQLAAGCAAEISRGADDGAELGAFHDLFQPQRDDNLSQRLAEFSPAGADAGIIYVT